MNQYSTIAAEPVEAGGFVSPENPRLKFYSTLVILVGSLFTAITLPLDQGEVAMYKYCAVTLFTTLVVAFGVEGIGGVRSLIRVDVVALATLYFLTFAEFLHPHVIVLYDQETGGGALACQLVMIGQCGIAVGRHISIVPRSLTARAASAKLPEVSAKTMMRVFFLFALLGYLYPLLMTNFNIFEIFAQLLRPRFDRVWQRGAIGDWRSALTELNLLLYIVAALGGYIFANARQFPLGRRVAVLAILLFMTFFDFSEGARNVLLIKVGLFLVTYFISNRSAKSLRIIILSFVGVIGLWTISGYMLDFRNSGITTYLSSGSSNIRGNDTFMIDNNMISIARVVQVFPSAYPYPGWDVVLQVFTKWIPRFIWPGKPTNWAVTTEQALNTGGGYTLAVTYIGEAYLISGIGSLIVVSMLIGAISSAWTRVGIAARSNMDLIYYASGFFAATLGMRSIQFVTIAMVPTAAFYVFGRFAMRRKKPVLRYAR